MNEIAQAGAIAGILDRDRSLNGAEIAELSDQRLGFRGYFTEDLIGEVHAVLRAELARGGAHLDAVYYCPHHPATGTPPYRQDCDCRKPKPGLLHRAVREHDIDLTQSWMAGDRYSDVQLAHNAGLRGAFVLSGYGRGEWEYQRHQWPVPPDLVAQDLLATVKKILAPAC